MGRKRQPLARGQSTNLYIPLDVSDDELNWINEQLYLNKSIFSLIRKELNKTKCLDSGSEITEIVRKEIARILEEREISSNEFQNTDSKNGKSESQSDLQKLVLQNLELL